MGKFIDLVGLKFGRFTVVSYAGKYKWLCRCDCGKEKVIRGGDLKSGRTKSCGCLRRETAKKLSTKHDHSGDRTYWSWAGIIQRCTNPNHPRYKDYGGRGIIVYEEWITFENFLKDMGECPKDLTIERINKNGNYCKKNCKWATRKGQARNKRNNHLIPCFGKLQCIAAWSEGTGIPAATILARLDLGWSPERTLMTPVKKYKQRKKKNEE